MFIWLFDCNARYNIDTLDLFSVGNMTTAAYTSVLCPNRSPVQGVKQNDQMYGDIVIPQEQNEITLNIPKREQLVCLKQSTW